MEFSRHDVFSGHDDFSGDDDFSGHDDFFEDDDGDMITLAVSKQTGYSMSGLTRFVNAGDLLIIRTWRRDSEDHDKTTDGQIDDGISQHSEKEPNEAQQSIAAVVPHSWDYAPPANLEDGREYDAPDEKDSAALETGGSLTPEEELAADTVGLPASTDEMDPLASGFQATEPQPNPAPEVGDEVLVHAASGDEQMIEVPSSQDGRFAATGIRSPSEDGSGPKAFDEEPGGREAYTIGKGTDSSGNDLTASGSGLHTQTTVNNPTHQSFAMLSEEVQTEQITEVQRGLDEYEQGDEYDLGENLDANNEVDDAYAFEDENGNGDHDDNGDRYDSYGERGGDDDDDINDKGYSCELYHVVHCAGKDAEGNFESIIVRPLRYNNRAANPNSTSYCIFGYSIEFRSPVVGATDHHAFDLTKHRCAENNVDFSVSVNPTGDDLRTIIFDYHCPANCYEGWVSDFASLQRMFKDELPDLVFKLARVCPVCIGTDLMYEQLALSSRAESHQLHDIPPVLDYTTELNERRSELQYQHYEFEATDWGFDLEEDEQDYGEQEVDEHGWETVPDELWDPNFIVPTNPAPAAAIAALSRKCYAEISAESADAQCYICIEPFVGKETVIEMPCGHLNHEKCAKEWLKNQNSCPKCRAKVAEVDDDGEKQDPRNMPETNEADEAGTTWAGVNGAELDDGIVGLSDTVGNGVESLDQIEGASSMEGNGWGDARPVADTNW